jgi:hypothetical protein
MGRPIRPQKRRQADFPTWRPDEKGPQLRRSERLASQVRKIAKAASGIAKSGRVLAVSGTLAACRVNVNACAAKARDEIFSSLMAIFMIELLSPVLLGIKVSFACH